MRIRSAIEGERLGAAVALAGVSAAGLAILSTRVRAQPARHILRATAALQGAAFAAGAWAHWVEPAWIETTFLELEWDGPSLRIVLLTDLHATPGGTRRIRRIVRRSAALRPDVVLYGGDFVEGLDADPRKLAALAPLAELRRATRLGSFAVLGNHDSDAVGPDGNRDASEPREDDILTTLDRAGVRVLMNEHVTLDGGVALVGLADFRAHESDPRAAFAGVDARAPTLVLAHSFKSLELDGVRRFDLAMAGHTHGGQGCVPFTDVCPFLEEDMKPYHRGLHDWPGGGRLYVSRGLGTSDVRARVGARPEIACIDMVTASLRSRSP